MRRGLGYGIISLMLESLPKPYLFNLGEFNPLQVLELERIRLTRYDRMDGQKVYNDLIQNRHLWNAARLVSYVHDHQRESLRALELGDTYDDTLLVSTVRPLKAHLERVAGNWKADAIMWEKGEQTPDGVIDDPNFQVLSVTWWNSGFGGKE